MSNFDTINQVNATMFSDQVYMLARQGKGIVLPLTNIVVTDRKVGERVVFPRLGAIVANRVTDRYQELEANTLPASARSCVLDQYHAHVTLDEIDDVKMIFDPKGPYVEALASAIAVKADAVALDALLGNADNKDGTSSTAFDSNQKVNGSSAITLAHLLSVNKLFLNTFIDAGEPIHGLIEGNAYIDLMGINEIKSIDFNSEKPLASRILAKFLNINFHYYPNMPNYDSNPTYQAVFLTKKALSVAMPQSVKISIDRIPERRNAILIQASFIMGAVRMEENQAALIYHT